MIVFRSNPKTGRILFVPCYYDPESDSWGPISDTAGFDTLLEASRTCVEYAMTKWQKVVDESRILRVLCEHPEFEFDGDSIDSGMICKRAQNVSVYAELFIEELSRLIALPKTGDTIRWEEMPGKRANSNQNELFKLSDFAFEIFTADDVFFSTLEACLTAVKDRGELTEKWFAKLLISIARQGVALLKEDGTEESDGVLLSTGLDSTKEPECAEIDA